MRGLFEVFGAVAVVSAMAFPAIAEGRGDRFAAMMARLPAGALDAQAPHAPVFTDFDATRAVWPQLAKGFDFQSAPDAEIFTRLSALPFSNVVNLKSDWTETLGFKMADVAASLDFGVPGNEGHAYVMALGPDALHKMPEALLGNGYGADVRFGTMAYWRFTADDFSSPLDMLRNRVKDDPFLHAPSSTPRLAIADPFLLAANGWDSLQTMLAPPQPGAVVPLLTGVLNAQDWGAHRLLQANIYSNALAFVADPSAHIPLTATPAEREAMVKESLGADQIGVPLWTNLMLADLSDGQTNLALVVLVYAAQSDAEAASRMISENWGKVEPMRAPGTTLSAVINPLQTSVSVTGDGPFATVFAVETALQGPDAMLPANRGYQAILNAVVQGDPLFLAPMMQ